MQVHFVNVGYGEAILVQRDDFTVLIDGGTNRAEEYNNPGCIRIAEYLKKIGISKVDLIIVTHIHDDHIGGIPEVIRSFPVSEVWINIKPDVPDLKRIREFDSVRQRNLSGVLFKNALESYEEMLAECEMRGIPVLQKGEENGLLSSSKGVTRDFSIEILTPDEKLQTQMLDEYNRLGLLCAEQEISKAEALFYHIDKQANRTSISLRVRAGKAAVLLSGDKVDGWDGIYKKHGNRLESQILKATHHGQKDGLPEAMIEVSQPEVFVICSSVDRRFDSAHPDVIERANDFLREEKKNGGVYITGCLKDNSPEEKEFCAVCFSCDESTGEISTYYKEA